MKGNSTIIKLLNAQLQIERTASTSYLLKGQVCRNLGYDVLAAKYKEESAEEAGHALKFIDRIIFLEDVPDVSSALPDVDYRATTDLHSMLKDDLRLETLALEHLKNVVSEAEAQCDYASADIARVQVTATEEHIDWVEAQLSLINDIGIKAYAQEQIG